ncbi:MAG: peptidoglycan-associated lipoprotein Pal [SAR324 cluster bacterium]
MNVQRVLVSLGMLGAVLACGCGGTKPGTPAPPKAGAPAVIAQEQSAAVGKADIDAKVLPAPRPALAAAPDLSGAVYAINAATLNAMGNNGVPADTVTGLRKLSGKSYGNTADFLAAANDAVGPSALQRNQDAILRNALVVTLAEPPEAPRGQALLDEGRARSQVQSLTPVPVVTKATSYRIVYFDFDKSNIKPEFMAAIKENAGRLIGSKANITIEGHCDERGSSEYNLALGQRRAEAVRQTLMAEGVPAGQMKTVSYGEERPVDLGHNEEAWVKNRRAVLTQ